MADEFHDEWCPMNGCRCKKCPCAEMPDCPRPSNKPRPPHPDTQIGRLPCTCNQEGRAAVWHITPCEIKLVHLESLR